MDTIWMTYGYRGHMGSVINLINNDVNSDVGSAHYADPWGAGQNSPPTSSKTAKSAHP